MRMIVRIPIKAKLCNAFLQLCKRFGRVHDHLCKVKLYMKTKLSILFSILLFTVFVNNRAVAQMGSAPVKIAALPDLIPKPTFEGHDSGFFVKVWIMSIINDMGNIEGTSKTDDDDINNTHDVLVQVEDENGKILPDEVVKLLMVTPSGKKDSVDLDPKSEQYGGSVAFTENGEYQLTVYVNADGKPAQRTFNYKIYR